jgi:hypothetical protein
MDEQAEEKDDLIDKMGVYFGAVKHNNNIKLL